MDKDRGQDSGGIPPSSGPNVTADVGPWKGTGFAGRPAVVAAVAERLGSRERAEEAVDAVLAVLIESAMRVGSTGTASKPAAAKRAGAREATGGKKAAAKKTTGAKKAAAKKTTGAKKKPPGAKER